ncbi:MAG: hypothetical protein ACJ77M_14930 [Thermoleophilaceae bacterium]
MALSATALAAGLTGTWSPCGFSMVETLGAAAARGERRLTGVASATFAAGALAGGAITFGGLALLGSLLGGASATVAVVIAGLAALGEVCGARIIPQIRRQVPEPWRRGMPLELAAALYGVLLGLGFTTFVLTWAVWALAGISVALGDPAIGLAIGIAFGAGRALPVVAMAPTAHRGTGSRVLQAMAERPAGLRLARRADALALAVSALLLVTGSARAATMVDATGADPSAAGTDLAWRHLGAGGVLERGGVQAPVPGDNPAVGGSLVAWRNGDRVTVAQRATLAPVLQLAIPGVSKLALSDRWLVDTRSDGGADVLEARALASPAGVRRVLVVHGSDEIGRPALDGDRLVVGVARGTSTSIVLVNLKKRARRTVRHGHRVEYLNPSMLGGRILYVKVTRCAQELRVIRPRGERVLLRRPPLGSQDVGFDPGHTSQGSRKPCPGGRRSGAKGILWTTALAAHRAFVTVLHPNSGASLLAVSR